MFKITKVEGHVFVTEVDITNRKTYLAKAITRKKKRSEIFGKTHGKALVQEHRNILLYFDDIIITTKI